MSHAAELSIVVVASSLSQVTGCLESLSALAALEDAEIIVVGSQDFSALRQVVPRLITVSAEPAWSMPRMRAEGLLRASGAHVAVLSEDYRVSDDWARFVISVDEQADVRVGEVSPPSSGLFATACYLWEYLHVAPPAAAGRLSREQACWVPAGAVVYRKDLLDLASISAARSEMEYHQGLFDSGKLFYRDSNMRVLYQPSTQAFLADRMRRSRDWARFRSIAMPLPICWVSAALRAGLPILLLGRFVVRAVARPRYWLRALASLPFAALFAGAETVGEIQGYLGRSA